MPVTLASALLGFCGLIYEFVFAQSLSVLFGHSVIQYSVTIGLFILGMGLGSHIAESFRDPRGALWRIQLELSLLVPALAVLIWWLALSGWSDTARVVAYISIFGVGALTGMELPLLLRLRENRVSAGAVLGADYLGMLAACVLFPLLLLPHFGVFSTLLAAALLNSVVTLTLIPRRIAWTGLVPAMLAISWHYEPLLRDWLSARLMAG